MNIPQLLESARAPSPLVLPAMRPIDTASVAWSEQTLPTRRKRCCRHRRLIAQLKRENDEYRLKVRRVDDVLGVLEKMLMIMGAAPTARDLATFRAENCK